MERQAERFYARAAGRALSDDGSLTGRGAPLIRGTVTGLTTALGVLGHTLPYLVPETWPHAFGTTTALAGVVVFIELWATAFIQSRSMTTPFVQTA